MTDVPRKHVFGWRRLALSAVLCALGVNIVMRLAFAVRTMPTSVAEWGYLAATLGIVAAPVPVLYSRLRRWRVLGFAALYTLGTALWNYGFDLLAEPYWEHYGRGFDPLFRTGMIPLFVDTANLLAICFLGSLCAWGLCRWVRGPVIVQTWMICPQCGYCLRGCREQICPECGREFSFEEVGTTREEFELYRDAGGRIARPIKRTKKGNGDATRFLDEEMR